MSAEGAGGEAFRFEGLLTQTPDTAAESSSSSTATTTKFVLESEEGKKASFGYSVPCGIDKPAHLVLRAVDTISTEKEDPNPFLLGGFEILSNSRNIEVYLSDPPKDDDDDVEKHRRKPPSYVTTVRGVRMDNEKEDELYRSVLAIPGGPRPVLSMVLKLLSLRPAKTTHAKLVRISIKGRLPSVATGRTEEGAERSEGNAGKESKKTLSSQQQSSSSSGGSISQEDVTNAVLGMTMLVRTTEAKVLTALQSGFQQSAQTTNAHIQSMEERLLQQQQQQQQLTKVTMEQQQQQQQHLLSLTTLIEEQQNLIQTQAASLERLQQQQDELLGIVKELKNEIVQIRQATTEQQEQQRREKIGFEKETDEVAGEGQRKGGQPAKASTTTATETMQQQSEHQEIVATTTDKEALDGSAEGQPTMALPNGTEAIDEEEEEEEEGLGATNEEEQEEQQMHKDNDDKKIESTAEASSGEPLVEAVDLIDLS